MPQITQIRMIHAKISGNISNLWQKLKLPATEFLIWYGRKFKKKTKRAN